jgi:hypothetical protein
MALQFAVATRNALLDAMETDIGASPTLEIRTGAPPADCATADSGTLLATIALPSDFLAAASGGSKAKAGTWQVNASGTGTAGHFRMKASGGAVKIQGTVAASGADMNVDNVSVASGQQITVTGFTLNAPGA